LLLPNTQNDNRDVYLEIHDLKLQNHKIESISNQLKLVLPYAENIAAFDEIWERRGSYSYLNFRVYNTGQALATSVSIEDCPPRIYIDYGMPFGNNIKTKPDKINMPLCPRTTIILTHIHKDHWFRMADDIVAYTCRWYIPNQIENMSIQLKHKIAEIIICNGTVQVIDKDIDFKYGKVTSGGTSRLSTSRKASHIHETGVTVRIEGFKSNKEKLNILIPGDQRYDYIKHSQLEDLHILVASHHGGSYCWSTRGAVPAATDGNSIIIYSYGKNNTYSHPNKRNIYRMAGWLKEHHTSGNGNFNVIMYLY